MTRFNILGKSVVPSRTFFRLTLLAVLSVLVSAPASWIWSAESSDKACRVLADKRVEEPLRAIADEYAFRTGSKISLQFLPVAEVDALVKDKKLQCDAVLDIGEKKGSTTPVGELPGATRVAWKYPTGEPVWAAVLTDHPNAAEFVRFVGGPTGHRLWSESKAGFTIVTARRTPRHSIGSPKTGSNTRIP